MESSAHRRRQPLRPAACSWKNWSAWFRSIPSLKQTGWLVGQIEGQEAAKGNVLPFNDLMIAAAAIEQGYAVLTTNLRHFQKIPNLSVVPF